MFPIFVILFEVTMPWIMLGFAPGFATDPEKFAPEYKNSLVLDSKKLHSSKDVSSINVEDVLVAAKQFVNF